MMINTSNRAVPLPLQLFAVTDLTLAYQAICYPFLAPCFYIKIINRSTFGLKISYDGIEQNDYVPALDNIEIYTMINRGKTVTPLWQDKLVIYAAFLDLPIKPVQGVISVAAFTYYKERDL